MSESKTEGVSERVSERERVIVGGALSLNIYVYTILYHKPNELGIQAVRIFVNNSYQLLLHSLYEMPTRTQTST